jgi:hypothetical protein
MNDGRTIDHPLVERVTSAMQAINAAWLDGRVEALSPLVHPDIVMALPGFADRARGRDVFLAGFRDFSTNAAVHEYHERDRQIDVVGNAAVVTFRYEMVYERSRERYRATGRDLWVFERHGDDWLAVWRAMLELDEQPA